MLSFVSGLHVIELANNPWGCDCRLRPLKNWLISNNVPYSVDPKCAQPPRLAGQQFANLQVDEFACPPKLLSAPRYVEANMGKMIIVLLHYELKRGKKVHFASQWARKF